MAVNTRTVRTKCTVQQYTWYMYFSLFRRISVDTYYRTKTVRKDSEHRIATAQSTEEGALPLKNPQKGMIIISNKTVKHTLRMSEQESKKLDQWSQAAGISKAEYVRQKIFGKEPQPMPTPAFWNHMDTLYTIPDRLKDAESKQLLQQLILTIQAEATQPKEVMEDGNHQPMAH